jgi:hypothetical protein
MATHEQIDVHYKGFFLFVADGMTSQQSLEVEVYSFPRTDRYSVLPALSLSGVLLVDIIEGSFTKRRFSKFIDALLDQMNPFPGPNSVIVMDNCSIHISALVQEMILER